jgi:proteasome activator subunit 4
MVWATLANVKLDRSGNTNTEPSYSYEVNGLLVHPLLVNAGHTLADPADPKYRAVEEYRQRFSSLCRDAASSIRQGSGGEDHIDAVIAISKAIDSCLNEYGRSGMESLEKSYISSRE